MARSPTAVLLTDGISSIVAGACASATAGEPVGERIAASAIHETSRSIRNPYPQAFENRPSILV